MGQKSKRKGKAFEDEVAKILTDWAGTAWKRLPASGALRWGGRVWTYGDLLPPEGWPVVLECKHHHDVRLEDLLGTARSEPQDCALWLWWLQALRDAARAEEELGGTVVPLVVWKRDYGQPKLMGLENFLRPSGTFFSYQSCHKYSLGISNLHTFLGEVSAEQFCTRLAQLPSARSLLTDSFAPSVPLPTRRQEAGFRTCPVPVP